MRLSLFSNLWFIYNQLRGLNLEPDRVEQANGKFKFKMNMRWNLKYETCFPMYSSCRRMTGSVCLFCKGKQDSGRGRICILDYSPSHARSSQTASVLMLSPPKLPWRVVFKPTTFSIPAALVSWMKVDLISDLQTPKLSQLFNFHSIFFSDSSFYLPKRWELWPFLSINARRRTQLLHAILKYSARISFNENLFSILLLLDVYVTVQKINF